MAKLLLSSRRKVRRPQRWMALSIAAALWVLSVPLPAQAVDAGGAFRFESVKSLDDMRTWITNKLPVHSPRSALRKAFVMQGGGTLRLHPSLSSVEKYLYDINLCGYYVWRWNISADYGPKDELLQAYVNGEPVFASGAQKKDVKEFKKGHQAIYRLKLSRPEAMKGEKELEYLLFDADSDLSTTDDQLAIGGGPSRADPLDMGTLHMYTNVEPWRSIFDRDTADRVVPYGGDCGKVDEVRSRRPGSS
jgi:hypothetical protein